MVSALANTPFIQLYKVNSRLADSPPLRTGAKSPAETIKKCMEIASLLRTPAIITELQTLYAVQK